MSKMPETLVDVSWDWNADKLILQRNLAYGAAASALVILIAVYQVGLYDAAPIAAWLANFESKVPFPWKVIGGYIALFGAAVALPSWFAVGSVYELYVYAGERSYPHLKGEGVQAAIGLLALAAGIAQIAAISGVLMHLLPEAFFAFGAAVVVSIGAYAWHYVALLRWWNEKVVSEGASSK